MRVWNNKFGRLNLQPGAYGTDLRSVWWARPPGSDARIALGAVIEHEDETITASSVGLIRGAWQCLSR